MANDRPKIEVPFEPMDIVIDFISATLLILIFVYSYMEYSSLPESIPTHFGADGNADGYSDKTMILLLPLLGLVMFVGLFIINKYPHIHNYTVNITESNALKNYRFSTRIVRFVNFFTIVLFAYIQYVIITSAKGGTTELGFWFLPIVIGFSIFLPIGILIYNRRINKT